MFSKATATLSALLLMVSLGCDGKSGTAASSSTPAATPAQDDSRRTPPAAKARRFIPPSDSKRRAAIGDVSQLPKQLSAAFTPSPQFAPITTPVPGDWLAEQRELGQSYKDYVDSNPNRARAKRRVIYIVPVGPLNMPGSPGARSVVKYLQLYYQLPVKMLPTIGLAEVSTYRRINQGTGKPQLLTKEIMALLRKRLPADAYCLIAVTETDLYPQRSWNFVFGMASLRNRVGVFSFARYHPSFHGKPASTPGATKLVMLRALKVVAHEVGHMFGIEHCTHFSCVMNGSNSMRESDTQPMQLCPVCLRKLHHARAFDPLVRYQQLAAFYTKAGLSDEATWAKRRASVIKRATPKR